MDRELEFTHWRAVKTPDASVCHRIPGLKLLLYVCGFYFSAELKQNLSIRNDFGAEESLTFFSFLWHFNYLWKHLMVVHWGSASQSWQSDVEGGVTPWTVLQSIHCLIEASDQFRAGVASLGSRLVDVLYLRLKHLALASATLIKWPNVWCENTVNFVSFLKEQELFEDRPCWPVMLLHLDLHVCTLVVVETSMFYIQSWCQRYWILQYWIFCIDFFLF